MRTVTMLLLVLLMTFVGVATADAWRLTGRVLCDTNGDRQVDVTDLAVTGAVMKVQNATETFTGTTGTDGSYYVALLDTPETYTATLDPASLPSDASIITPASPFTFTLTWMSYVLDGQDWLIGSASCRPEIAQACWLTGGGVKFDSITKTYMAEKGPRITFGGNVFPSCDPASGQGGQWNHVDHAQKLHFQGTAIETVACGNVPGVSGSTSPDTPFSFIEYRGTGRLTGISGNKVALPLVYFFARAEDRNEPGSNGAKDGALIDRYFLHVFSDPANPGGSSLLLFDGDVDAATTDPVLVTGGNLQLHISSCDNPPLK